MITKYKKYKLIKESNNFYSYNVYNNFMIFEFDSIGIKGTIKKAIIYEQVKHNTYNLALVNVVDDKYDDDLIETNNGDIVKILTTIYQSINDFFDRYPDCYVEIIGNTEQKVKLYSKLVERYYNILIDKYQLNGYFKNKPLYFSKGQIYDKLVISKKDKVYYIKTNILEMNKITKTYCGNKELTTQQKEFLKKQKEIALKEWETVEKYMIDGKIVIPEEDYYTKEEYLEAIKNYKI